MAEQEVQVPNVAESVSEVTLLNWLKQVGERVEIDDPLCEVETDKANVEIPSPLEGVITSHEAEPGDVKAVGDVLVKIDPDAEPSAAASAEPSAGASTEQAESGKTEQQQATAAGETTETGASPAASTNGSISAPSPAATSAEKLADLSPAVRRLVSEKNLVPDEIPATGPGGRLTKEDVLAFVERKPEEPAPSPTPAPAQRPAAGGGKLPQRPVAGVGVGGQPTRREPMSKIRKRIAANLVEAQQTAAILTTFNEVDLTEVMALRKTYKEPFEKKHGVGLGFMSFFAKATCAALQEFERVNARLDGDEVVYHDYVNMGIAVSTERGLTVPVIRDVQSLSFAQIESEIKRVAVAARDGKLGLNEMSGGTFTITNGGVFGSLLSTPILNPPQSGILGMHTIQERPMAVNGEVKIRPMMYIALSYDHRLVDGRESVSFLVKIKQLLENPGRLLLDV